MEENKSFESQLQSMLVEKQRWYNEERLLELLEEFRLLHTCVRTIYDFFIKKSLLVEDPYRMDQRISDIEIPNTEPFGENEIQTVLSERFSKYETMLDFVCTYYRFSVDGLSLGKIKKLMDLNNSFYWEDISMNSAKANVKNLAIVINKAKVNNAGVALNMLTDSIDKCVKSSKNISRYLVDLSVFQREYYKGIVRKDIIEGPNYNKEKVNSVESEIAEIKRLFVKVMGKKPFYNDLITEIANEDFNEKKEALRNKVLAKLEITERKSSTKETKKVDAREFLVGTVLSMGTFTPILIQLRAKLVDNFELLFFKKETLFTKFIAALKKALGIKNKEHVCEVKIIDQKTGSTRTEEVYVNDFLTEVEKKIKTFNVIVMKNAEYAKIVSAPEDSVLSFVNKQLSEVQSMFTTINALDTYFKNNVEGSNKIKVKGMKIDLDSFRNAIINVNKKRGEYISIREETEQLQKLGIKNV